MNTIRYKFIRICKKLNLEVNGRSSFAEIKSILDQYFIQKTSVNKIIKQFRIYKLKKNYKENFFLFCLIFIFLMFIIFSFHCHLN